MGEALNPKYDGEMAIIDGFTGTIYVDPDEETLAKMQEKRAKDLEQKELLNQLKGKENVTKSGQKINVYANIGNVSDLGAVLKNDAGGVGLFRSEFLYLENSTYPTEEQQFGNTDEIAAESADAVDETEDYAGLEDVEPEFPEQDAPVQRDGADDDGEYPGIRF